jgi:two-component system sensor histidine kinase ChiS
MGLDAGKPQGLRSGKEQILPDDHLIQKGSSEEAPSGETEFSPIKVALVEDEMINAMIMEHYFHKTQVDYRWFSSGEDFFHEVRQGYTPDILLLDLILPGETGLKIAAQVRQSFPKENLPIFLISAKNLDGILDEAHEAGIAEIIAKPVGKVDLFSKVKRHVGVRAQDFQGA